MSFADLGLSEEVLNAVSDAGYTEPTPIQAQAIPTVLMGRDILGCAQTGTGKTASFTLPMIDILASGRGRARMPRTLILEPTRELAAQVAENFDIYGKYNKLSKALIIGGSSMAEQSKLLDRGVDVLIATPGRLLDLFDRGGLLLSDVKVLVIDEADRMLDMGFIPDVEKIVSVIPKIRQTLFFSATMPPEIKRLADAFLMNPKEITVARPSTLGETITQGLLMIDHHSKRDLSGLQKKKRDSLRQLIKQEGVKSALVFCNRKKDVDIVNKSFVKHGFNSATLHGDMVQSARMATMEKFKAHEYDFLICSDVAARGLDIDDLSHVFNFDVPMHAEDYVHRIGRTGRAGKQGRAFSLAWKEDKKYIEAIEKITGKPIPRIELDGTKAAAPEAKSEKKSEPKQRTPAKNKEEKPAEEATAAQDTKTEPEPKKPARRRAPKKEPKEEAVVAKESVEEKPDTKAVDGWGDHMPAFLLRSVK
jgi:superfamily II DNA/RNA helicase